VADVPARFVELLASVTAAVDGHPITPELADLLDTEFPADGPAFAEIEALCHAGCDQGWLCGREAASIRFGRPIKPGPDSHGFSVDVVLMDDLEGPHHRHPNGEIDMVMPIDADARFDGTPRGWKVYAPGSAHHPTVRGGKALVLYLLPAGAIEFTQS
jgi:hypothetical protein